MGAIVILDSKADLLEIIEALGSTHRFTYHLNGRQKNPYEYTNDGNHY